MVKAFCITGDLQGKISSYLQVVKRPLHMPGLSMLSMRVYTYWLATAICLRWIWSDCYQLIVFCMVLEQVLPFVADKFEVYISLQSGKRRKLEHFIFLFELKLLKALLALLIVVLFWYSPKFSVTGIVRWRRESLWCRVWRGDCKMQKSCLWSILLAT